MSDYVGKLMEAVKAKDPAQPELVSEYTEGDAVAPKKHDWDPDRGPRPERGYIGVQNHPHGKTVYFKEISIRPIER